MTTTIVENRPETSADIIRRQLAAIGLSQRAAARELALDERTLRRYCTGDLAVPPVVTHALRWLEQVRLNEQVLSMLEDGLMSTSDGSATHNQLVAKTARLRQAIQKLTGQIGETTSDVLDAG
jgi:ribosome-binding protein aMBF1 (putative translation factor)